MGASRTEQGSKCPCCSNLQIREGFQKVLELKDIGLVIYCQHLCMDDVNKVQDVVLIHNTNNMKITSAEALHHIDQNRIPCPRCKQRIRHAQELLKKVPTIDESDVMAVCEHCRLKALPEAPCTTCEKILKGFLCAFCKRKEYSKKSEKLTFFKDIPQEIPTRSRSEVDMDILKSELPKPIGDLTFHSEENVRKPLEKLRKMKSDTRLTVSDESERKFDAQGNPKRIHKDDVNKGKMKTETESDSKAPKILKSEKTTEKSERKLPKKEEPKTKLPKEATPKIKLPTKEEPKTKLPKEEMLKTKLPKKEEPKSKLPKEQEPKIKLPKKEEPKTRLPKEEIPKIKVPKKEEPKTKKPKEEVPKTKLPKKEEPKTKLPKEEVLKTKLPKKEEPKPKSPKDVEQKSGKKDGRDKGKNTTDDLETSKNLQPEPVKKQEELSKKDRSKPPIGLEDLSKKKPKQAKEVTEHSKDKEKLPKKHPSKDDKSIQLGEEDKKTASKKAKEDSKPVRNAKAEAKPEPIKPAEKSKIDEKPKNKEPEVTKVKLIKPSIDNLMLNLIKLKKTEPKMTQPPPPAVDTKMYEAVKKILKDASVGSFGKDSLADFETDIISNEDKLHRKADWEDIIIGEHLAKFQPPYVPMEVEEHGVKPMLFQSKYLDEAPFELSKDIDVKESSAERNKVDSDRKGIMHYALSDRTFIEKGWTMLPTEKVVRKMNVYRMRPAHPEFDWFQHNKNKRVMEYDTGEKLAEINDNGRGRWYYKNGQVALDYYDAEESNAQQRFVVYSSGQPDERGRCHPITILATFDYLGNGIVFDHTGKIRIKYNQTEGVLLDRSVGPVSHWKWHTLNDPPVLQQVMIDTQMAHKDPAILKFEGSVKKPVPDNEDMLAIEFDNFIKEKSKKLSQKFKPFQIKMKALKINEQFSLKVLDQATVYLIFRDGSTNLKLNIGMVLDHQEIVDTDIAELGKVSNNLERFPARTDSLAEMQRNIAFAQRYERFHNERERRLRPTQPCASADKLVSAASRPLRRPLTTISAATSESTSNAGHSRKPSNNLYYNTRLI